MHVQGDFLAVPALSLTVAQAERRYGLDRTSCEAVLEALADAQVLRRSADGAYTRFFPRFANAA
jgi:hypothetical protein